MKKIIALLLAALMAFALAACGGGNAQAPAAEDTQAAADADTDAAEEETEAPVEVTGELEVSAIDDKTLEVVVNGNLPYWNELLAFPTYFPVREDVVDNDGTWATDPATYVTNGKYKLTAWDHNSVITLTKNEDHYDADDVSMNELKFYLSDDANNMLANFKNGEWLLIDDVPTNEISTLKEEYPDEFVVEGQIGTYYVIWNVNEDISPVGGEALTEEQMAEVRAAIGLLFDRNYIVNDIAQGGQVPASSFVAMGITEPNGDEFYEKAGDSDDYVGYYPVDEASIQANYDQAIEILSKYYTVEGGQVTNFPTLTYLYNTSEGHKAIGEYLQSALAGVGITMNLENQEWATFLETRKNGDFSIARNGWIADYNDAICFLDMWTTGSGNNDAQFGRDGHADEAIYNLDLSDVAGYEDVVIEGGKWSETFDVLISDIKAEQDLDVRNQLMHKAEDLLMSTGAICPLYFYTDLYMLDDSVEGFYSIPLGYKYFQGTTVGGAGDSLNVCIASEPQTIDPALNSAVDGATMLVHLFSGLAKWGQTEDGKLEIQPDVAEELVEPVDNGDGTFTYTYKIRDDAVWSDGQPVTANDFVFAWNRAAGPVLAGDYNYMYEVVAGYDTLWPEE